AWGWDRFRAWVDACMVGFPWAEGGFGPAPSALARCSISCRCLRATCTGPVGGGWLARTAVAKSPGKALVTVIGAVVHAAILIDVGGVRRPKQNPRWAGPTGG